MNNEVAEIGELVKYNGYIRDRTGNFIKCEMDNLKIGNFYEVTNVITDYNNIKDNNYYKLKLFDFFSKSDLWYPHDSFDRNFRKFMIKKYNLI